MLQGQAMAVKWISDTEFMHWDIREANWIGRYNLTSNEYDFIYHDNIARSLEVISAIVEQFKDNPFVIGLEPVCAQS